MAKILIVDDEEIIRYMIRRILEKCGHDLVEAENGKVGLELAHNLNFDLIITDVVMPGMEGVELIATLKRENPAQRIIAISGEGSFKGIDYMNSDESLVVEGRLKKPFTPSQLTEMVDTILAR